MFLIVFVYVILMCDAICFIGASIVDFDKI